MAATVAGNLGLSSAKQGLKQLLHLLCPEHTFDFWMQQFGCNVRLTAACAKVLEKTILIQQDHQVVKLLLKPNSNFEGFRPGQHVRLGFTIDGKIVERSYSIANAQSPQGELELYIKTQGQVSRHIANKVKVGDVIELSQAFGDNAATEFDVFVAGGIGITAMWPLFYSQCVASPRRPKTLVYLANSNSRFLLKQQIESAGIDSMHQVIFADGRTALQDSAFWQARLNSGDKVISCGSAGFNQALKLQLGGHNCSLSQESFAASIEQATVAELQEHTVYLRRQKRSLKVTNQQPVLQSLLEQGIETQFGCKQGICHQCSCKLIAGSVRSNQSDPLRSNIIQTCVSLPLTDLELEL